MEQTLETPSTTKAESFNSLADVLTAALDGSSTSVQAATTPAASQTSATPPKAPETPSQTKNISEPKASQPELSEKPADEKPFLTPKSLLDRLTGENVEKTEQTPVDSKPQKAEETLEKVPENLNPAAQTAFAKLTKELREAKSRLKEMETKISDRTEAVEQKGGDVQTDSQLKDLQTKLEQFQAEREELENELRLGRVEATREYKVNIGDPMKQAKQTISEIAKAYEMRDSLILDALNESDGPKRRALLREMTSNMDPVDALTVRTKIDELLLLNSKREEMVKDSKRILDEIAKTEEAQEKAARAKYDAEAKTAFNEVWGLFEKELPLIQKVDGNEQWNKMVDSLRAEAERLDAEPLDHKRRAALTFQAVTLPLVVQVFNDYVSKTNKELASLRSSLGEYRKATPSVASGQTPAKNEIGDPNLSFIDAIEKGG
jgi:hypothetical protein